jgi:hypothetical protein
MQAQTLRFAKVFMRDRSQRCRSVKPGARRFPPFFEARGRCDSGRALPTLTIDVSARKADCEA